MGNFGTCRLCKQRSEIRESHFFPRAMYALLRGNVDPKFVQFDSVSEKYTTKQIKDRLLCDGCEERFNSGGERWVLSNGLQKSGRFPLQIALKAAEPTVGKGELLLGFDGSTISGLDVKKLGYFGASIFWRAAAHDWTGKEQPKLKLGIYEEQVRKYLLGLESFPKHASLSIWVADDTNPSEAFTTPSGGRVAGGSWLYSFHIPGFLFLLSTGQQRPDDIYSRCAIGSQNQTIYLTSLVERFLKDTAARVYYFDKNR